MFEIYNFSEPEIMAFILVLIRISAFFVTWPLFGTESVPPPVKILLSLTVTLAVFSTIKNTAASLPPGFSDQIVWLSLKEVFIGVSLGFMSRLFFFALQSAGELLSLSIGLSSDQIFNPTLGGRTTSLQQFYVILASIFFLSINGHYLLISAIIRSFEILPLSMEGVHALQMNQINMIGTSVIEIGLKLAAPVMAAVFLMNVTMGVIGRAVPQINVLVTSIPVNIAVGFFMLVLMLPLLMMGLEGQIISFADVIFQVAEHL